MTDIAQYLQSGIIENYCLGVYSPEEEQELLRLCDQYPEVQDYLEKTQRAMEAFVAPYQKASPDRTKILLRQNIQDNLAWGQAQLNGPDQQLPSYIGLSRHSQIESIQQAVSGIEPPLDFDNIYMKTLYHQYGKELYLVWVKKIVPDELHPKIDESFFILEGTADCHIDDHIFKMKAGDFMRIPPESDHKVIITSPYPAKAIMSRVLLPYD